jgi:FG-GAP-like repeat
MHKNYQLNSRFRALKTHESILSWLARFIASLVCVISSVAMAAPSDLSGDGKSDLIFRNNSTGEINAWLMSGGAASSTAQLVGPGNWSVSHTADFNGDGKADILFRNDDGSVSLWLMNGLSPISQVGLLGADPNWRVSHVGDFNGDGKLDILWRNSNGAVTLWLMNGTTVASQIGLLGADPNWSVTHVADFNGDGKADLLWQNTNGAVTIWLMNGSTTTSAVGILGPNPDWRVSHTADLNGDGKADLIWRNINGAVTAWLMNGTSQLSTAGLLGANADWSVSHTADFNGDGKSDLLWRNTNGAVTIWLMNGLSSIAAAGIIGADPTWRVTHTGDYDGDGKADIVWRSTDDGYIRMWLMNGIAVAAAPDLLGPSNWVVLPSSTSRAPRIAPPIGGGSQSAGFADPRFVRGAVRTEYSQGLGAGNLPLTLSYGNNGDEGCLWNATDPINTWGCAGRTQLFGSIVNLPWKGDLQFFDACRGLPAAARVGDSWTSCITYRQSNLYSLNWIPNTDYWVVVANSDPSFDQCNLGPPGLSWPVVDPMSSIYQAGYFKVGVEQVLGTSRRRAHLIINADEFSHKCKNDPSSPDWIYTIPFLSVGAQQNRGQSQPIAYITNPPSAQISGGDNISFDATMYTYKAIGCRPGSICPLPGAHAGMYITAQWGGKNRQIFLDYFGAGSLALGAAPITRHWNWPIADSFLYPGAEIVFLDSFSLQNSCGITFPTLPQPTIPTNPETRITQRYAFNASEVFACANRLNKFGTPMPLNTNIPLVGVHWYVESAGTTGAVWVAIENMNTY